MTASKVTPPAEEGVEVEGMVGNGSCITCINSFIAYHNNDLEILTVATVCPISKSDRRIERYHMIKFSQSACILFGWNQSCMINLN